jgi:hypothetical protein
MQFSTKRKPREGGSMIRQVQVLALLLMIHGSALLIVSGFALVHGLDSPQAESLVAGLLFGTAGVTQIVGGRYAQRYRDSGFVTACVMTCLLGCCTLVGAPFSIIIAIYGAILMNNQQVQWAFAERQRGATIASLFRKRYVYGDERDDYDDEPWEEPPKPDKLEEL